MLGRGPTLRCKYLGGQPGRSRATDGRLKLDRFELAFEGFPGFKIPLAAIRNASVEGAGEIDRRVTATRVFGLGLGAWAMKKREDSTANYLTIEYERRGRMTTVIFEADTLPSFGKRNLPGQGPRRQEARRFAAEVKSRAAKARQQSDSRKEIARGTAAALGTGARAALRTGQAAPVAQADRIPCPHCGEQIKRQAKVCRFCDRRLDS
jgi:hypothetical protein